MDGRCILLKAGIGASNQEPYNEAIASELHRRLLPQGAYVPYYLVEDGRRIYSACDNMLVGNEELISAYDLIRKRKQRNSESNLQFYVRCCEELGLTDIMQQLAWMFVCDFILANRDRHWRNFGVIRDCETLRGTRLAPIFDTGSCLWSDAVVLERPSDFDYVAKPFKYNGMKPRDQLRLFLDYLGFVRREALAGFTDFVEATLATNPNIPPARINTVTAHVQQNIQQLMGYLHE